MTDTAIEQRDEAVAEAILSGRSLRWIRKQFSLSVDEIDAVLARLWPIDHAARIRMIRGDLGKLERLTQIFYEKAVAGCVHSGLLTIRVLERKHELLGMNSAVKIEIVQTPAEAPDSYDKIHQALLKITSRRKGQQPDDSNGQAPGAVGVPSLPSDAEPGH